MPCADALTRCRTTSMSSPAGPAHPYVSRKSRNRRGRSANAVKPSAATTCRACRGTQPKTVNARACPPATVPRPAARSRQRRRGNPAATRRPDTTHHHCGPTPARVAPLRRRCRADRRASPGPDRRNRAPAAPGRSRRSPDDAAARARPASNAPEPGGRCHRSALRHRRCRRAGDAPRS